MEPAIVVALLWTLFGVIHIGLATLRIRGWLVSRLGEVGFTVAYSAVAIATASIVIVYYSHHRYDGDAGLALGAIPVMRPVLIALIVVSVMMMLAAFATYDRSPYAILGKGKFPEPRGLERITRHPFFVGLVIFAIAHVLLATRLVGAAFAAGFGVIALVGMMHQDQKLTARYGAAFVRHLEVTSALPFAAIVAGRQRMVGRELPVRHIVAAIVLAIILRAIHGSIFAHSGWPFVAFTVATLGLIGVQPIVRARQRRNERAAALTGQAAH
jgi:uncharacterized membrane protein